VQNRTGLTIRRVLRQLRPLRSASIAINGVIQEFPPSIDDENRTLIDSITRH